MQLSNSIATLECKNNSFQTVFSIFSNKRISFVKTKRSIFSSRLWPVFGPIRFQTQLFAISAHVHLQIYKKNTQMTHPYGQPPSEVFLALLNLECMIHIHNGSLKRLPTTYWSNFFPAYKKNTNTEDHYTARHNCWAQFYALKYTFFSPLAAQTFFLQTRSVTRCDVMCYV